MTTKNPVGFCSRCNQQVLLTREDIDVCLAIILLIFTAGIGLIIYLAIYYRRSENICVHCGTKISTFQSSSSYTYQPQQLQNTSYSTASGTTEELTGNSPNFCALCGEKIESGVKFCPNCGGKIMED